MPGSLFLADRGYPSYAYLAALDTADAAFVRRAKENLASKVVGEYRVGGLPTLPGARDRKYYLL